MKKAPQVRQLREDVSKRESGVLSPVANGISNGSKMQSVKHGFFLTLEKMTRKFKVMFLKLENKFTSWNESMRQKRKNHSEEAMPKTDQHNEVFSGDFRRSEDNTQKVGRRGIFVRESLEERLNRPMVSEKAVMPEAIQPEIKDRFEKLLIERIAVNPKDTEAYERLGEYYFEIRNYNYAKECFKQVIKLNPANQDAKNRMKRLEKILSR
jgi:tetratricopeptide (TPR) repeat protein